MSYRMYILLMSLATALAMFGWVFVLMTFDPIESGLPALVLFYVTFLMSLIGALTCMGVVVRVHLLKRQELASRQVRISFRHALFVSCVCVVALALSSQGLLHWWLLLLMLGVVCIAEYLFLAKESAHRL